MESTIRPSRNSLMYTIYIVMFGTAWGFGASILAGTLPPDPITRSIVITWYEVIVFIIAKLVLLKRFVVTQAMLIATIISIFTFSFGPPNPLKPMIAIAGLAFDAGTRFRTNKLGLVDMIIGLVLYIVVAYSMFALMFFIIDKTTFYAILPFIPIAATIYLIEGVIAVIVLRRIIPTTNPSHLVQRIRDQINEPNQ
jgi:hypothetical protein